MKPSSTPQHLPSTHQSPIFPSLLSEEVCFIVAGGMREVTVGAHEDHVRTSPFLSNKPLLLKQILTAKGGRLHSEMGDIVLGTLSISRANSFSPGVGHWGRREVEEKQHLGNPVDQGLTRSLTAL